jgi:hypothetical protein
MEQISILGYYDLFKDRYGSFVAFLLFYLALPIFIVLGLIIAFVEESVFNKFMGILSFVLCGVIMWFGFKERAYKPEKSFAMYRGSRELIQKRIVYKTIASIILMGMIAYFDYTENGKLSNSIWGICALAFFIYYTIKSFKVHEDVDFVTSTEIEDIIGVEIGEKMQATYQNFDSSIEEIPNGAKIIVVTDKKIYFSYNDEEKRSFLKKNICEISKIGIYGGQNDVIFFKLLFLDDTSIFLHMETYDKVTSNPVLFLSKLLGVIDAVVLGTVDEKISSRRRVTINHEKEPIENQESENKEIRHLDISDTVLDGLRNATSIESGRVLEF